MGFHRAQERRLPEPPRGDHRVALGESEGVVDESGELPPSRSTKYGGSILLPALNVGPRLAVDTGQD